MGRLAPIKLARKASTLPGSPKNRTDVHIVVHPAELIAERIFRKFLAVDFVFRQLPERKLIVEVPLIIVNHTRRRVNRYDDDGFGGGIIREDQVKTFCVRMPVSGSLPGQINGLGG